ncbi:MAG TPA: MATE family efflux transporter, partial [Candidatus Obscuribacterales bacterium]
CGEATPCVASIPSPADPAAHRGKAGICRLLEGAKMDSLKSHSPINQNREQVNYHWVTSGPLARVVWEMTWPLLTTYVLFSLIGLVDAYLAGLIGDAAQAAVGIGEQVIFLTVIAATGLSAGTVACVARSVGAGDIGLARLYARDSALLSAVIGLLTVFLGIATAGPIFDFFGSEPHVSSLGVRYLEVCSIGNLPYVVALSFSATFRASGMPRYALWLWLIITALSIGGSLLLFFSNLPGIGRSLDALSISWIGGATIGVIVALPWFERLWTGSINRLGPESCKASSLRILELLWIGFPALVADLVWVGSNFVCYKLFQAIEHPAQVQAAWSIAMKIEESCAAMPLLALSMAVAAIVGQNLGAREISRAREAGRRLTIFAMAAGVLVGLVVMLFARPLASAMSHEPLVVDYTASILVLAPLAIPPLALSLILLGALEGAGCTWLPMLCNLVTLIGVRVLLLWLLSAVVGAGVSGALLAWCVSRLAVAALSVRAFKRFFRRLSPAC